MKRAALLLPILFAWGCDGAQDRLTDEQAMRAAAPGEREVAFGNSAAEPAPAALPQQPGEVVYKALGTAPGWSLTVRDRVMLYQGDGGTVRMMEATPPRFSAAPGTYRSGRLALTIAPGPCSDGVSPHEWRDKVTVVAGGNVAEGCGGGIVLAIPTERSSWSILAVNGQAVDFDAARYFLRFSNREIQGALGCNSFGGRLSRNGDHLTTRSVAATQMGCPEPQATLEREAMAVLSSNMRIEQADGRTRLISEAGTIDLAPRQQEGPTT